MILNKEIGYYVCDGREFSSKIAACIYGTQNKKEVQWVFNDSVFSRVDWTIEPSETLTELYNRRARELREKYDYIVLSYSAGADSHNVLMSFLRQNLHIDEILVNTFEGANKIIVNDESVKDNWNYGAEYKLQVYPRLEEIRKQMPKTKITVVDLSDHVFEKLRESEDPSWVLDQKEVLNPSGITRYNYLHFKEIRKQFDRSYKIGMVMGIEKPTVYIKDNKFHLVFFDRSSNIAPVHIHFKEYDNTTIEYFYWHPTCTKMIAKQVHTVKKWLLANPQLQHIWEVKDKDSTQNGALVHQLLRDVIYSDTWNNSWYQASKSTKFWYDEIDQWFFDLYKDTPEYANWERGVNWVKENAVDYMAAGGGSLKIFHKIYYAGDFKI